MPFSFYYYQKITARETTNWQDQIINLINAEKNWQESKSKSKKDSANWIKRMKNQKRIQIRFSESAQKMIEKQAIVMNSAATFPDQAKLSGFDNYQDFLSFSQSLFQLNPEEYQGLFSVLLKLQSIGQDAVETMLLLESNTDKQDCYELIRFMIQIDGMDVADIHAGFLTGLSDSL